MFQVMKSVLTNCLDSITVDGKASVKGNNPKSLCIKVMILIYKFTPLFDWNRAVCIDYMSLMGE